MRFESYERFLVISGSINPVTRSQIKHALEKGFGDICLDKDELGRPDFFGIVVMDSRNLIESGRSYPRDRRQVIYLSSLFVR